MIKKILSILGFISKTAALTSRSTDVFNIFNKTVIGLQAINDEIIKHKEKKLAEKAKIEVTLNTIDAQHQKNTMMIAKVNDFIGE